VLQQEGEVTLLIEDDGCGWRGLAGATWTGHQVGPTGAGMSLGADNLPLTGSVRPTGGRGLLLSLLPKRVKVISRRAKRSKRGGGRGGTVNSNLKRHGAPSPRNLNHNPRGRVDCGSHLPTRLRHEFFAYQNGQDAPFRLSCRASNP
jgi:hypothetical protein